MDNQGEKVPNQFRSMFYYTGYILAKNEKNIVKQGDSSAGDSSESC